MFSTTTPEKPAWILSALAIIGGVFLLGFHHSVPTIVQGLALAGLVAAVTLADAGTSSVFPWVLVSLAVIGIVILAGLSDAIPTWLEAVAGLGVVGGGSLATPSSSSQVAVAGLSGVSARTLQAAPGSTITTPAGTTHIVGPNT